MVPLLMMSPAKNRSLLRLLFWVFAYLLLTYIYGTAYESFRLGGLIILVLLPVHICYFYCISRWALPSVISGSYVRAVVKVIVLFIAITLLYRLVEIFIANPLIFSYYKNRNPAFTWPLLEQPWWKQLMSKGDFVNAMERSNVVVWIGITVKIFSWWQERRNALLQAELSALKAQVHPHFLFNSLNNLYALALKQAPQTPQVVLGLANMLRYVIYECQADKVPLDREVAVLKDYLALEQLRYEDRLDVNLDVELGKERWNIAPLLMLPLVENAFKHGAGETTDLPWINIELRVTDTVLQFKISNSKPELKPAGIGRGIGLNNLEHRLALLYPGTHSLDWYDEEDCFILEMQVSLQPAN